MKNRLFTKVMCEKKKKIDNEPYSIICGKGWLDASADSGRYSVTLGRIMHYSIGLSTTNKIIINK